MKKIAFLLLACFLLSFTLVSCGDNEEKPTETMATEEEQENNDMEVSFDDLFAQ